MIQQSKDNSRDISISRATDKQDIFVDYEYGTLKEVIVGVPFMILPDFSIAKWALECMKVLPEADMARAIELSDPDFAKEKYNAMEQENQALIAIFEQYGIKVWRPEILTADRIAANFGEPFLQLSGASQQYVRDPILVIGSNVIENTMGSLVRRADILGLQQLLQQRVAASNACLVSMPGTDYSPAMQDGIMDKTLFPALEGGDVLVLGKKILVGNSQNITTGSSALGYAWLKSFLEPQGYDVECVRLPEDIMHLDVALSVPRPGLIIVCPEVFLDGIPKFFAGWKRIEVSREEARHLAVNGLSIDPDNYIMGVNDRFDSKRIQRLLESEGITVHAIPFAHHTEDGGSIRCSAHPLVRRLAD